MNVPVRYGRGVQQHRGEDIALECSCGHGGQRFQEVADMRSTVSGQGRAAPRAVGLRST